jgi:hypothetical protein
MPAGYQHSVISLQAYKILDSWEKKLWQGREKEISYFAPLPDGPPPEYEKYCILPNGKAVPHGPTDKYWTAVPFVSDYNRDVTRYVLSHYINRMIDSLLSKDISASLIYGGILSHYIADSSHPAHIWNNLSIYNLLPPPEGRYWQLHRLLDNLPVSPDVSEGIISRLLGLDVEETIFHVVSEYEKMVQWGKSKLVPIVNALYSGDEKTAEMHVNTCYKKTVGLLSSLWHTIFSIAFNRRQKAEVDSLKEVRLNELVPVTAFTVDPYFFYPLIDSDCDGKGNLVPLSLKVRKSGNSQIKRFSAGIAMTFGYLLYEIPPSLFKKISVKVGISPLDGKKSEAVFKIIDAKTPPVYRDAHRVLVNCGGRVIYKSARMTGKDVFERVDTELGKADLITLFVECLGENKNIHAVWADPLLLK